MKISAISNQYSYIVPKTQQRKGIQQEKVTFQSFPVHFGKDLVHHREDGLPSEIAEKMPKGVSIYDLINRVQTPENILGQGANSIVYNFSLLDHSL